MSTQPPIELSIPMLKCMYPDCGNEWLPRTTHKPKVCPRCKRYGWEVGSTGRRKGGRRNVKKPAHLGPKTKKFLESRKET